MPITNSVIRTDAGFECKYYPTIMDGPVFRWRLGEIEINASRNGVGADVCGMVPVQLVAKVLAIAESVHLQLKKNDRPVRIQFGENGDTVAWSEIVRLSIEK